MVTALVLFTGGEPTQVVVDGTTFDLPQLTQTVVAGEDLAAVPTPNPNSRDVCYIHAPGSGSRSQRDIVAIKEAGSYWTPTEQGTPTEGTNVEYRIMTLDLTADEAVSIRALSWRVVLTDTIPTGVELIP